MNWCKYIVIALVISPAWLHASIRNSAFSSYYASDDSSFAYLGYIRSLDPLDTRGWLLRASVGKGTYEYGTGEFGRDKIKADISNYDFMMGYQWFISKLRISFFSGLNIEEHELSPVDPGNPIDSERIGIKNQFEVFGRLSDKIVASLIASIATGYDSYFINLYSGYYLHQQLSLGLDGFLVGNSSFHQERYGIKAAGIDLKYLTMAASFGVQSSSKVDTENGYGVLEFGKEF